MVVVMLVLAGRSGGRRGCNAILPFINQTPKHPKKEREREGGGAGRGIPEMM